MKIQVEKNNVLSINKYRIRQIESFIFSILLSLSGGGRGTLSGVPLLFYGGDTKLEGNSYIVTDVIKSFKDAFKLDDIKDKVKQQGVEISDEELKIVLKSFVKREILRTDGFGDYWIK